MSLTKAQLQTLNATTTYANNNNEVEAANQQAFFDAMIEAMYPVTTGDNTSIKPYSPTTTYEPGPAVAVLYNDTFWKFVSLTARTGVEPGTDETVWVELPSGALSHLQNTDFKNGLYLGLIDGGGTVNLIGSEFAGLNTFILEGTAGGGNTSFSLVTGTQFDHPFLCYVPVGATYSVTFSNDPNQNVGTEDLVLVAEDFAVFRRVAGKTRLMYSNKRVGGAGGNPFDQDLNKTNSPQFVGLKLTARAGTGTRAGTYDALGNLTEAPLQNLSDTVLNYLTFYDPILAVNQKWGPVNGVWTLIETI